MCWEEFPTCMQFPVCHPPEWFHGAICLQFRYPLGTIESGSPVNEVSSQVQADTFRPPTKPVAAADSEAVAAPPPGRQCNNVYVSNLLPELGEDWLRKEFGRFGLITSAKLMVKNGISKVCLTFKF